MGDIAWKNYLTVDDNTTTTTDTDGNWEDQLLAKAAGAKVETEDSGEEEGGVTKYMAMKEALVQVNHIIEACSHAQQQELNETFSKLQVQITDYRLLMAGQTTQQKYYHLA